ncbi:MAG: HEAT repeat domain-containing protein [Phycisphaerae bacterium]
MSAIRLPPAFKLLLDESNPAADAALVEALPQLEPALQAVALEMLVQRAHVPTLATVVARFDQYDELLQKLILARAGGLTPGIRSAVTASTFEQRAAAIDVIVRGSDANSAYLLAEALRIRCNDTRSKAAAGLCRLAEDLDSRFERAPKQEEVTALDEQAQRLSEALSTALRGGDAKHRAQLLRAALILGNRIGYAILNDAANARSGLRHAFRAVARGFEPRLGGALVAALALPELRSTAADAIADGRPPQIRAVLSHAWLLGDPRVERGCHSIRVGPWVSLAVQALGDVDHTAVPGAVRFLSCAGGPPDDRARLLRELLNHDRGEVRRAALWRLVRQHTHTSTDLLRIIASRERNDLAPIAKWELRRRGATDDHSARAIASQATSGDNAHGRAVFERFWNRFDNLDAHDRTESAGTVRHEVRNLDALLRARLASSDALERARAVRVISCLGMVPEMAESLCRLASDPEPSVRSLIMRTFGELPGPVTNRILRAAVNDPDHRVQADAIEAMDLLDLDERIAITEPKLDSPDSRVRANAIKSLLRAGHDKAGETLLNMLDDPAPAHRISALWVVARLKLKTAGAKVRQLSLTDPDERVRRHAERAVRRITSERPSQPPPESRSPVNRVVEYAEEDPQ